MTVKLPVDPDRPPEMQRFFDDLTKIEDRLQTEIDAAIAALPAFASEAQAEALTSTTVMMSPARTLDAMTVFASRVIHVQERQDDGDPAGTFTAGAWQTRLLDTEVYNGITGASLASNQITLPAGTYYVDASAPAFFVGLHQTRIYNATDAALILPGTSQRSGRDANGAGVASVSRSHVRGRFTIAASKAIELNHFCATTHATNGFGAAANCGITEVYSDVVIWKLD